MFSPQAISCTRETTIQQHRSGFVNSFCVRSRFTQSMWLLTHALTFSSQFLWFIPNKETSIGERELQSGDIYDQSTAIRQCRASSDLTVRVECSRWSSRYSIEMFQDDLDENVEFLSIVSEYEKTSNQFFDHSSTDETFVSTFKTDARLIDMFSLVRMFKNRIIFLGWWFVQCT